MTYNTPDRPERPVWRLLRRRWLLAGAVALVFALVQMLELWLWNGGRTHTLMAMTGWGLLGGGAVWVSLRWAATQERRAEERVARALREQQALNVQLQRSNAQLELLSATNRGIAASATLDDILDAALIYPRRLVPAQAVALYLRDEGGDLRVRGGGAPPDLLDRLHVELAPRLDPFATQPRLLALLDGIAPFLTALHVPLYDGVVHVGAIELFHNEAFEFRPDQQELLATIASEIAEAIESARRRAHEERAAYELERAIADERARIARDIHDGIAQSLAFARMRVDLWQDWITQDPTRLHDELHAYKGTLREQIRDLRRAIFALRPILFDELGFAGGLQRYVVEFAQQQNWEATVDLTGAPAELSPELEAICFRIVQEALTNVAKHANAVHIDVHIGAVADGIRISVRDDGSGFDPAAASVETAGHFGLRQIRERLAAVQGHLTIRSEVGAGAELEAWIPLKEIRET